VLSFVGSFTNLRGGEIYAALIRKTELKPGRHFVTTILDPDSEWEMVSQGHKFTDGPVVDREGDVFFTEIPNNRIHEIDSGATVSVFMEDSGNERADVRPRRTALCVPERPQAYCGVYAGRGIVRDRRRSEFERQRSHQRGEIYFSDSEH